MKLLVVEDEAQIVSFLLKGLRAAGYEVVHSSTGEEGLAMAQQPDVDLVVLDLGLPDLDGTEVLRRLSAGGADVPVIVLTARGELPDRVEGLDQGADDYLAKPFAFEELLARIRARLRRRDGEQAMVLHAGGLALDLRTRRIRVDDREVELTAREFELMEMLMRHRGEVLSRERLLSRVWGLEFDPGSNVVDVYIGHLRRKLGEGSIETVRGAGYRLRADRRQGTNNQNVTP
jgi:two-component system, OmpR family, copper resistance phosphate regulon response regulator CusR